MPIDLRASVSKRTVR